MLRWLQTPRPIATTCGPSYAVLVADPSLDCHRTWPSHAVLVADPLLDCHCMWPQLC